MLMIVKALFIAGGIFSIGYGFEMGRNYGIDSLIAFVSIGFALIVFGRLLPSNIGFKLPRINFSKKKQQLDFSTPDNKSQKQKKTNIKDNFAIFMLIIYLIIHALYLFMCKLGGQQGNLESIRRIGDTICVYSIGMVIVGGIYWQYILSFKKDRLGGYKIPKRIKLTALICLIFISGIIGREIIGIYVVKDTSRNLSMLFNLSYHAILLSGILLAKTYFGPLVITSSLAVASFYMMTNGEFMPVIFVNNVFSTIIDVFPETFRDVYLIFTILYVTGASFRDTFRTGSNVTKEFLE